MARTVALGTITQALIDTQDDVSKTPYISVSINDNAGAGAVEYWSRLEYLEYHEETYRDRAVIGLNNRDNALDNINMDGQEFTLGLGYDSSGHGGTTTDTVAQATLWVKSHQILSVQGDRIYQIFAEGMWMSLREQKILTGVTGDQDVAYASIFNRTKTVEALMKLVIEAMGWTWTAVATSDNITDIFLPVFNVNLAPFESGASLLYRLISMTKSYLRPKTGKVFEVVYPQITDPVDETYYSDQAPYFLEHDESTILLVPNSIVVLCNQDPSGEWNTTLYPLIVGTAQDPDQFTAGVYDGNYHEVIGVYVAGSINNQADADKRADAILTQLKSETFGGRLVLPFHDCRMELYDRVEIDDQRGH